MKLTQEAVIQALSTVIEPDFKKDLISLNMIRDIVIDGNKLTFKVVLTTPACPLKDRIERECREAIEAHIEGRPEVEIEMIAEVISGRSDKLVLPGVKHIVAVVSGKGGVGKSTVAANLAVGLGLLGARVGLLDADIHGPSVPLMFGISETPEIREENGKQWMVPLQRHGIKLMSIGFMVDPDQAIVWRGPMISSALRQFASETDWGDLDYLILDMPPGTGDIHLTMAQILPLSGVLLVTTPQEVATADAIKSAMMFEMLPVKVPVLGVVENMSWFTPEELPGSRYLIFGKGGGQMLAAKTGSPLMAQIPLVMGIRDGADKGLPTVMDTSNPAYSDFLGLASEVARGLSMLNAERIVQQSV